MSNGGFADGVVREALYEMIHPSKFGFEASENTESVIAV
jgi:hypothetical protein